MEQNEGYKRVEDKIKSLEHQLSVCDEATHLCEQSGREAEKDIEEHFARCINALAERKAVLIRRSTQKVINQKRMIEDTRVQLEASIEACKQTLKAGSMTYAVSPNTAQMIWKTIVNMPILQVRSERVSTLLPQTLFFAIYKHGEVGDSSVGNFCKAEIVMVTTLAGASKPGVKDGRGLHATFNHPWGMCLNPHDQCLYICDSTNNAIRRLTIQGDVSTLVVRDNRVRTPSGIAMNHKQNCFYVANYDAHTIVKITAAGMISMFAGSGKQGNADGVGANASFCRPYGIAIDQHTGNLFVSECSNHLIRKITPEGEVSTLAGSQKGFADGNGRSARLSCPVGMCYDDSSQSILVCDYSNHKIRQVQLNGDVSTLCEIRYPTAITVTANKTILVASDTEIIYKVTHEGSQRYKVEILAGTGRHKRVDGGPEECCFFSPRGVAVHEESHVCFIADADNHAIRKISFADQLL